MKLFFQFFFKHVSSEKLRWLKIFKIGRLMMVGLVAILILTPMFTRGIIVVLAPGGKIGSISQVLVGFFCVSDANPGPPRYAVLMMFKRKRREVILSKEGVEKLKKAYEKADD